MIKGLIGGIVGLLVMIAASWAAAVTYINTDGGRLAEKYLQPFGGKGKVRYGSVHKAMFSGDLVINDIRMQLPDGQNVRIGRVMVRRYDWLGGKRPSFADVTMESVIADTRTLGPMVQAQAAKAGIKTLDADIRYAFRYNAETQKLRIETVRISLKDIGELTLRAAFAGTPKPDFSRNGLVQALLRSRIVSARLVFSDRKLAERIVQTYGAASGKDAAAAKGALIKEITELRANARNGMLKDMYGAALSYISKPGKITVQVQPARPVRIATLAPVFMLSPSEVKRMLALKISTSGPSN